MNDDAWLQWRTEGITATDVADAANGTYGGAYRVLARKQGRIQTETSVAMERGHRWQPKIADAVAALTEVFVVGEETWCEHSVDTRWRATVDGFIAPVPEATLADVTGVIEIKTYGTNVKPHLARWDDQMQWQMLVTGLDRALLAAAKIDDDTDTVMSMWFREVEADAMRQMFLMSIAEGLWRHVEEGTLPEPESPAALEVVKEVYSDADTGADTVDLSALEADLERFAAIKAALKEVKDEHDLLEARIRDAIGSATRGHTDRFTVSVSAPRMVLTEAGEAELLAAHPEFGVVKLDRAAVKKADKELYDSFTAPVGARILTIRETHND